MYELWRGLDVAAQPAEVMVAARSEVGERSIPPPAQEPGQGPGQADTQPRVPNPSSPGPQSHDLDIWQLIHTLPTKEDIQTLISSITGH